MLQPIKKEYFILIFLAVLKFVLPGLLQHTSYDLHRDEYLYYAQGQHLALGFLENPPMISFLGWISSILGGSSAWIKFWPSLFGAATLLLTCGIVRLLGGRLFAQVVASLGILFTAYLRVHFLFQPNFLDIFWCTATAFCFIRYLNNKERIFLYLALLSLALGWWSKYSIAFFGAGLFLSVLFSHHRVIFKNTDFWKALAIAVVVVLPNLIWQHTHGWPLLHHMNELQRTQLQYRNHFDFVKEQLLMLLPVALVWISGWVWLLQHRAYRVIGLTYLFLIALLMLGNGKGYYALGGYPMLLAAGGVWLEQVSVRKKFLRYAVLILILIFSLPLVPLLIPMQKPEAMAISNKKYRLEKTGMLKWEDQQQHSLQQDFADMQAWRELTEKAEKVYNSIPDMEKANTVVYCRHYGQASALIYHAGSDAFRDKVFTDDGSFLLWIPDTLQFRNLVFVGREMPPADDSVFVYFARRRVIDSVTNIHSRQYGDKIILFEEAAPRSLQLANEEIRELKQQFRH